MNENPVPIEKIQRLIKSKQKENETNQEEEKDSNCKGGTQKENDGSCLAESTNKNRNN